jgi:NGP1NT (NUC091) domain
MKPHKPHHRPLNRNRNSATNADRVLQKGETGKRDRGTIKRLKMYNARPVRDKSGKVLGGQFMSKDTSHSTRIAPNRRWFVNTRTVGQTELDQFRDALEETKKDPYAFILKQGQVPIGLVKEPVKERRMHLLEVEPFSETFSAKRRQKRAKIGAYDYDQLLSNVEQKQGGVCVYFFLFFFLLILNPSVLLAVDYQFSCERRNEGEICPSTINRQTKTTKKTNKNE